MKEWGSLTGRGAAVVIAALMLAGCQTVSQGPAFSREQAQALEEAGFQKVESNYELGLDNRVLFSSDSSDLQPSAVESISALANTLRAIGIFGATVEGHTNSDGSESYNQALSEKRALSVKDQLVIYGMADDRIRAFGFGESEPIASNDTEDGKAQNRRVVIVLAPADALPLIGSD